MSQNSDAGRVIPRATYRFQFNRDFALRRAVELVPYLRDLGVSHVYTSPLLKACPCSTHGYDVCDHSVLNPEIGTEKDLEELSAALRQNGMGIVLDIVPNHMGICGRDNPWWWDVLKNGRNSRFASYFDIDWEGASTNESGKVTVPALGDTYERVLERGELTAAYEEGEPVLRYFENRFPIAPETLPSAASGSIADQLARLDSDRGALDALIQKQNYRLVFWREANDKLNYRRFFEITTLASIRVEDQKVFDETHAMFWKWRGAGWVEGLRVDHPDGLADPAQYFERLRDAAPNAWIVAEKILAADEQLPGDWPISGTTGYDFMSDVTGLFIDPEGERPITDFYGEFTGEPTDYRAILREKKLLALKELFGAEVNRLTRLLVAASKDSQSSALTEDELRNGLAEVIADLPVYRTYAQPNAGKLGEATPAIVSETFKAARGHRPDLKSLDFIEEVMLLKKNGEKAREFVSRLQQLTGAAMAKGAEDTAFYCFNRFLALNLVGGDPGRFSYSVDRFHERCVNAQKRWPNSMLSTSTHDTKQSEEVRMRLCALSEIPSDWGAAVKRWSALNAKHRRDGWPDRNMEYFYYQTLVGAWPLPVERAIPVMEKAARQARQHTSWTNQNAEYEKALRDFVTATLDDKNFIADAKAFTETLVGAGEVNSLGQTLLKLTTPGVPDIYQGTELWNFSLHDPDNRRPVGYERRKTLLAELKILTLEEAWRRRAEGLPKLWVIQKTLQLRARHPDWFNATASYEPIRGRGEKAGHVIAFARRGSVVTIVPRLSLKLAGNWRDTNLALPKGEWLNEFTGETVSGGEKSLASLLHQCPVAFFSRKGES